MDWNKAQYNDKQALALFVVSFLAGMAIGFIIMM